MASFDRSVDYSTISYWVSYATNSLEAGRDDGILDYDKLEDLRHLVQVLLETIDESMIDMENAENASND